MKRREGHYKIILPFYRYKIILPFYRSNVLEEIKRKEQMATGPSDGKATRSQTNGLGKDGSSDADQRPYIMPDLRHDDPVATNLKGD